MNCSSHNSFPHCCEIWLCHLGSNGIGIQSGYRPVLILSNDKNNLYSPTINIAPLTSKMNKRGLPVHVELWDYRSYGLLAPSTILIEQVTTVHVDCLDKRIGVITDRDILAEIRRAISIQFPLLSLYACERTC